ncbi:MAG: glycosyltransferase family 2 protein [Cyanobacteria bacterium J06621_8]
MLAFVIPIKSPKVATSWQGVCQLFERTLRSVCNQTSENFLVVVVCNEIPQINFSHPNVKYLKVDFPVPNSTYGAKGDDKAKKIVAGLLSVRDLQPNHIMPVDPDDCVSNKIASFVESSPNSNGWYVDQGYEYDDGSNKIAIRKSGFNTICGSCNIINYKLFNLPESLLSYEQIKFDRFINGHPLAISDLAARGNPIEPLPFPGAIFIRDKVGESISMQEPLLAKFQRNPKETVRGFKKLLLSPINTRKLTKGICEEFGLCGLK